MTSGAGSPCLYSRDVIRVTGGVYAGIMSEHTVCSDATSAPSSGVAGKTFSLKGENLYQVPR